MTTASPPAVVLLYDPGAPIDIVRAIAHGCEEEGVPLSISASTADMTSLAMDAAVQSSLFTGIGVDARGSIEVRDARSEVPVLVVDSATPAAARLSGVLAGRLVRGRPLPRELLLPKP